VLIFKACEHVGHKNASMTLSTPPSAGRVPRSYDDPLSWVKLPKMSHGGRVTLLRGDAGTWRASIRATHH